MKYTITKVEDCFKLQIQINQNTLGLLYKISSILFLNQWEIVEAFIETESDYFVNDLFIVKNLSKDLSNLETLEKSVELIQNSINNPAFFEEYMEDHFITEPKSNESVNIKILNSYYKDSLIIDIQMKDRPGIIMKISKKFYELGIDILSFRAFTENKQVRDTILVKNLNHLSKEEITNQLLALF